MSFITFKSLNNIAPNYLCSVILITPEEQLKIISPHPILNLE